MLWYDRHQISSIGPRAWAFAYSDAHEVGTHLRKDIVVADVCPLCVDPLSNEAIGEVLMKRLTPTVLGKRYGIAATQVNTHISKHVQMALRPALRRIMLDENVTRALATARSHTAFILVDKMSHLSEQLERLMRAADDMNPVGLDDDGSRTWNRLQAAIDSKTKLLLSYIHEVGVWSGDIQDNATFIGVQTEHAEFRTLVLNTLKQYPDVLVKVQESMMDSEVPSDAVG